MQLTYLIHADDFLHKSFNTYVVPASRQFQSFVGNALHPSDAWKTQDRKDGV